MIDRLLAPIAPHLCCGCGKIGSILCDYCKYDILNQPYLGCLQCAEPVFDSSPHKACTVAYSRSWCVSQRDGSLERLINSYKFENARSSYQPLASLLDSVLPVLPKDTIIAPVPTTGRHIRRRGYDHMDLICKALAKRRKLSFKRLLSRQHNAVQLGSNRQNRIKQAQQAFVCRSRLHPDRPYLLVDDVVTTGSTLKYAALALEQAGAKTIWVAAIAKQPLD